MRISLGREELIGGLVVGPDGRPVKGATVWAMVDHAEFRMPNAGRAGPGPAIAVPIEVNTSADGRFVMRGIPRGLRISWWEVRHHEFQTVTSRGDFLSAAESMTLKLAAGCSVSGVVVDESGRSISGADVQIRSPSSRGLPDAHAHKPRRSVPVRKRQSGPVDSGRPAIAPGTGPRHDRGIRKSARGKSIRRGTKLIHQRPRDRTRRLACRGRRRGLGQTHRRTRAGDRGARAHSNHDHSQGRHVPIRAHFPGKLSLTGLATPPRRIGRVTASANSVDAVIRLELEKRQ